MCTKYEHVYCIYFCQNSAYFYDDRNEPLYIFVRIWADTTKLNITSNEKQEAQKATVAHLITMNA